VYRAFRQELCWLLDHPAGDLESLTPAQPPHHQTFQLDRKSNPKLIRWPRQPVVLVLQLSSDGCQHFITHVKDHCRLVDWNPISNCQQQNAEGPPLSCAPGVRTITCKPSLEAFQAIAASMKTLTSQKTCNDPSSAILQERRAVYEPSPDRAKQSQVLDLAR
jgi:hypothetical protein